MKGVAFFVFDIGDLSGGGGYERFFSDFFEDYSKDEKRKFELYFIVDDLTAFNNAGKLLGNSSHILYFKDYRFKLYYDLADKIFFLKGAFRRSREIYTAFSFYRMLRKHNIGILHLPNYLPKYFFLLSFFDRMRSFFKVKIAVTIVDCRIPFQYDSNEPYYIASGATKHSLGPLFEKIKLDGVFTWYKSFREFAVKRNFLPKDKIYPIHSRYVKHKTAAPPYNKKENVMLIACRLDEQKRPMDFVNAVKIIKDKAPETLNGWKFKVYGKGVLENDIKQFLAENSLNDLVEMTFSADMKSVLENTKCLVSTQAYENFPSLSIYEGMVTGNAIIAYNVGQTSDFIRNGYNGIVVNDEGPDALAKGIQTYLESGRLQEEFYKNNLEMIEKDHNYEHFKKQIEEFWEKL